MTILCFFFIFILAACGGSKERVPYDAPGYVKGKSVHPTVKIGKPYRVKGKKYYPEYDPNYDETGGASWYGPNFHGKSTANGEKYNQWAMTAAHKTLPLPSVVRVTHQKTGKSIIVRVNDRGPFANGRIIDLSRAAAEALGTIKEGVAPVRVQYLKDETEKYIAKLRLKKPSQWHKVDVAKSFGKQEKPEVLSTESAAIDTVGTRDLPPPVMPNALAIPQVYAKPQSATSTLDVRGVVMEEIGYAEDPFSVLKDDEEPSSKPAIKPHSSRNPKFSPFKRVSYGSGETGGNRIAREAPRTRPITTSIESQKRIYVQAGSFRSKENAYRLAEKLTAMSAVDVNEQVMSDGSIYRVRIGPTLNEDTAYELKQRLRDYGIRDAKIVRE